MPGATGVAPRNPDPPAHASPTRQITPAPFHALTQIARAQVNADRIHLESSFTELLKRAPPISAGALAAIRTDRHSQENTLLGIPNKILANILEYLLPDKFWTVTETHSAWSHKRFQVETGGVDIRLTCHRLNHMYRDTLESVIARSVIVFNKPKTMHAVMSLAPKTQLQAIRRLTLRFEIMDFLKMFNVRIQEHGIVKPEATGYMLPGHRSLDEIHFHVSPRVDADAEACCMEPLTKWWILYTLPFTKTLRKVTFGGCVRTSTKIWAEEVRKARRELAVPKIRIETVAYDRFDIDYDSVSQFPVPCNHPDCHGEEDWDLDREDGQADDALIIGSIPLDSRASPSSKYTSNFDADDLLGYWIGLD
ncbi:hypothetical protein BDV95DRAFT_638344 [Massariosphaeria phaeospora]|uniref:Uncharacterized protein n=1 Tax=Massariosphaeria phaeospora TaxID=100035 RepID=A0A7C8I6M5_9PLEO|nr:hypothetical protein BDV95DRAFT_638344 [Massariosphaeria phaeospora]